VPDPDEPLICVTDHVKFTHELASEPVEPGSDCVVAHVPFSDCADVVTEPLGLVRLLSRSHAALAANAAARTANSKARRFNPMISLQMGRGCPSIIIGLWRF
jgi:hypothetical protein